MDTYDQAITTGERRLKRTFWRVILLALTFIILAASILIYITDEALEATRKSLPFHKLGNDIKTELALYHLLHGEQLRDTAGTITTSSKLSLERVDGYVTLILEGGQHEGGTIIALAKGSLRDQVINLQADIAQLKRLEDLRLTQFATAKQEAGYSIEFDQLFASSFEHANQLWLALFDTTKQELDAYESFHFFGVAGAVIFIMLMAACVVRYAYLQVRQSSRFLVTNSARTQALFDADIDSAFIINELGAIERSNRAARNLFGYTKTEFNGQIVHKIMADKYVALTIKQLGTYFQTGQSEIIGTCWEIEGKRKNGSVFPMEIRISTVGMGEDNIFFLIVRDISEQVAARAELKKFKDSLDQTQDSVFMFSTDNLKFTYVNKRSCDQLGYREEELMEMTPADISPNFDEPRFRAAAEALIDGREDAYSFEIINRHKDGRDIPVEMSLQYFVGENKVGQFLAIAHDITERKLAEERLLKAKEDAEKANHAKSAFLSRMSHELRTPLNAIVGFSQVLDMDELTSKQHERIGYIKKAGDHLTSLINEVLDIARIESGQENLSMEAVCVDTVLAEAWNLITPLANERNIRIEQTTSTKYGCYVLADIQRLKQVLLNLLSNAVKYNRHGGTISLLCTTEREGTIRISISDTGPGIAEENRERIFEAFSRLEADEYDVEGTGVGLTLSRALIESMGGVLSFESTIGVGSVFWLELPSVEVSIEQDIVNQENNYVATIVPENQHDYTVLTIEDNVDNLRLIEAALSSQANINMIAALHGELGIDLTLKHKPDLILLDLHLPGISGDVVLARLKANPVSEHIPIIMVSADATQHQIDKLIAAGAYAYLTKPFNIKELLATIDAALDSKRSMMASISA